MTRLRDYFWPVVGIGVVIFCASLLYGQFKHISWSDIVGSLRAIPPHRWGLAVLATVMAYMVLGAYDRIALIHLGKTGISWLFVALTSFTSYALGHNIGASVLSGGVVRYRAYRSQGLSPGEVAVLIALCAFTYTLGSALLGGLILIGESHEITRILDIPPWLAIVAGIGLLAFVGLYVLGSWLEARPLQIGSLHVYYPRLKVVGWQLVTSPLEVLSAAAIIYFALPADGNPGYFIVLGVYLASFSLALVSHAPGGLGVLELVFISAMPDMRVVDVTAALIVFRILYLLVPLAFSVVVVLLFERWQFAQRLGGAPRT